jgi:hypothetical protein
MTTGRLALRQPAPTDLVNVTTDINDSMDKIDAAVGFEIVTALPAAPYSGKPVANSTDGYRSYFHNGTAPASAGWVELLNSSGTFDADVKLASSRQLVIGADTNLFRNAANVLRTNDSLIVDGSLTVSGTSVTFPDAIGLTRTTYKTSDQTVNNTTTLVNATGLSLPIAASGVYAFDSFIMFTSNTTPDFKFNLNMPTSCVGTISNWGAGNAITTFTSGNSIFTDAFSGTTNVGSSMGGVGTGTAITIRPVGYIKNSTNAGTVQFQFAQNTANASDTVLKEGSWFRLTRLA